MPPGFHAGGTFVRLVTHSIQPLNTWPALTPNSLSSVAMGALDGRRKRTYTSRIYADGAFEVPTFHTAIASDDTQLLP